MTRKPWESRFASPQYREARAKNRHENWSDRNEKARSNGDNGEYQNDVVVYVEAMDHAVLIPMSEFVNDKSSTINEKYELISDMLKRVRKVNYGGWRYGSGGLLVNFLTETQASAFRLMCPFRTERIKKRTP